MTNQTAKKRNKFSKLVVILNVPSKLRGCAAAQLA